MSAVATLRRPAATAMPARPRKPATHHRPAAADKSIPGILHPCRPDIARRQVGPKRLVLIAAGGNDTVQANRRRQMRCGSPTMTPCVLSYERERWTAMVFLTISGHCNVLHSGALR